VRRKRADDFTMQAGAARTRRRGGRQDDSDLAEEKRAKLTIEKKRKLGKAQIPVS
jgi:hypothetical protein